MAGLLGDSWDDPRTMAALQMASGLLASGGPSRQPQNLGVGLLGGLQQYQGVMDNARRQKMAEAQFGQQNEEWQMKKAEHAAAQAQGAQMIAKLRELDPTGKLELLYRADPKAITDRLFPKGMEVAKINPNDHTPESFAAALKANDPSLLRARTKAEFVNGVAVDPYAVQPGTVMPNPNQPFSLGNDGRPVPNQAYQQYELKKAAAGGTRVNVPVSMSTEKSYGSHVAEGLAKYDIAAIDAATTAPERVGTAQQVKEILRSQNVNTGTWASQRTGIEKALSTAGLIDGQKVANTEALGSLLAGQTLDAIKSSGLGGGQGFTDKDRQFLERARAGNLEMNPNTLFKLADMNERAGRAAIARGNAVGARLKGDKNMGSVGQSLQFQEPPRMPPVKLPPNPSASSLISGEMYDLGKGRVGTWDGFKFNLEQ